MHVLFYLNLDLTCFYSKDSHEHSHVHVGLDSINPGPQNGFDRWILSFDKRPRRILAKILHV